jgi:DNA (cytosine-5)-methyltransferase 1
MTSKIIKNKAITLSHFSLFSGIGGADLAAEWAGFESIGQVEFADYPTKVLEKHWPNVPRWRDIHDVSADNVRRIIGDKQITVLSGGFPCQPFSVAGKRKGKDDNRFLWPQMLRVISELKPTWVIGENVNGFVNMGLEDACTNLESQGYAVQAFVIPACAVQAWHERKRVFIVAHSKYNGRNEAKIIRANNGTQQEESSREKLLLNEFEGIGSLRKATNNDRGTNTAILQNSRCELREGSKQQGTLRNEIGKRNANIIERPSEMVLNSNGERWEENNNETRNISQRKSEWESSPTNSEQGHIWEFEPNVGRVVNGVPSRVDRLKCLGNAIVPQQIYPIFNYIYNIETMMEVSNDK